MMSELWTVLVNSLECLVSWTEEPLLCCVCSLVLEMLKKEMREFNENVNQSKYQIYPKRTQ